MAVGDLAQGEHRGLVVLALHARIGTGDDLPRALGRHQHQLETVVHVVQTIFNSDASHAYLEIVSNDGVRAQARR